MHNDAFSLQHRKEAVQRTSIDARFRVACTLRVAVDFRARRRSPRRRGADASRLGARGPSSGGFALGSTKGRVYPGRGSRASAAVNDWAGRKIAKTTPCKVESATIRNGRAARPR